MVKFIIISEIRTGYKWVASHLCSHPKAFCFGEIFGSVEAVRQQSMFNQPLVACKENENPTDWLKNNVEKWAEKKNLDAIGFKINYVDGKHKSEWYDLWKYISSGEYRVIHLTRKNLIDRALSEMLAHKENNWANAHYNSKIDFNPEMLVKMITKSEYWQWEAKTLFPNMFELKYETIPEQMESLQKFLDLKPHNLNSDQIKQRNKKQGAYIKNYAEIRKMITTYFPRYRFMLDNDLKFI
jgi:hypothetical protein